MAKSTRIKIKMQSTASEYFVTTTKNSRNTTEKLKRNHYDPKVRKHVEFKEEKVK